MNAGLSELYHVGVIVPDVEAAAARLTELLGLTWGPMIDTDTLEVRDAEGNDLVLPNRVCFSVEAPHLELIQHRPGTVWVCNEHSNLHHIGFFSGALAADSSGLTDARCPMELVGRRDGVVPATFAYHRDPLGIRLELVDVANRPYLEDVFFKPAGPS